MPFYGSWKIIMQKTIAFLISRQDTETPNWLNVMGHSVSVNSNQVP